MIEGSIFWVWFGTFYLVLLTWQDYRNKMLVDDRRNWFMMGLTVSLFTHYAVSWWFLLLAIFIVILFGYLVPKIKGIGEADVNSVSWSILGFSILGLQYLFWYAVLLVTVTATYYVIKHIVFRLKGETPFYLVLLLGFFLNNLLWGLYL